MRARHLSGGDQAAVDDEGDRLGGDAVTHILPHRRGGERGLFGAEIALRIAVVDQLGLEVHRRRPDQVGPRCLAPRLGDDAVIDDARFQIVIAHLDARIGAAKGRDQRLHRGGIGIAIDAHHALAARIGDQGIIGAGITGRALRIGASGHDGTQHQHR